MSEFDRLRVVTWYEFLKHLRRKRLYVIMGVVVVAELAVLVGLPTLGEGYPENVMITAAMLSIGSTLATMGAVFFAGDAIAGEFEGKTGYILFPNPVRRTTLVVGKYLACYAAVTLLILLGYVIVCVSLLGIHGHVPVETAASFGLCLLFAGSVISLTFFFSAVSKGAMGATVMTLVFLMIISGVLDGVLAMAGQPTWFLLSRAGDSIITVYAGYAAFWGGGAPHGAPAGMREALAGPDIGLSIAAMAIYLVACFVLSLGIAKGRQLA